MLIISIPISETRMEAAGSCIYGIREFLGDRRQDIQEEQNIRKKKLTRRLHLEKTRAGALFRLWIPADMGQRYWELQPEMEELPVV